MEPPRSGFYKNANSMSETSFQVLSHGIAKRRTGAGAGAGADANGTTLGNRRKSVGDLLEEQQHAHMVVDEVSD